MTTMIPRILECPNCSCTVESMVLGSTNNMRGTTTDFRSLAAGTDPVKYLVHTCGSCGFSGEDVDFKEQINSDISDLIDEKITPFVHEESPHAGRSYEVAAWIAEWKNQPNHIAAFYYQGASWCCKDAGQTEECTRFQKKAADGYRAALEADEVSKSESLHFVYLIGELYRMAGEQAANQWLEKAEKLAMESGNENIQKLARHQIDEPQELIPRSLLAKQRP